MMRYDERAIHSTSSRCLQRSYGAALAQRASTTTTTTTTAIAAACLFLAACSSDISTKREAATPTELTVMSFNIWRNGGRSLERTIEVIRLARADVVGLQECDARTTATIAGALGFVSVADEHGNAIVSRYPITLIGKTNETWGGIGATIEISATERVHMFNVHLHYDRYGPYLLAQGKSQDEILAEERTMRMPGLEETFAMMTPVLASSDPAPTFLVGDFNAPSHLDYTDFAWPETIGCEQLGLVDAYRELHPENRRWPGAFRFDEPGISWTPILEEEPNRVFDRIDFVFYAKERRVTPTRADALDERNSVTPWPSDHRAIVATVKLLSADGGR